MFLATQRKLSTTSQPWLLWCVYQLYWTAWKLCFLVNCCPSPLVCFHRILNLWASFIINLVFFFQMISWQALGAYVDLATYYVFGIPVAAALGFLFKLRGPTPWIGLQAGAFLQTILLFIITNRTNWEKQVYSFISIKTTWCCCPKPTLSFALQQWNLYLISPKCTHKSFPLQGPYFFFLFSL